MNWVYSEAYNDLLRLKRCVIASPSLRWGKRRAAMCGFLAIYKPQIASSQERLAMTALTAW
jgi:hypothetical protein